jgi:ribosomal protein L7/L12
MNNKTLFLIVLAFCIAVLAVIIRFLFANRQKDKINYEIMQAPEPEMKDLAERVSDLIDEEKRPEAIRLVREETDLTLSEAEDFVDSFETGIEFLPTGDNKPLTTDELEGNVFELLLQNKRIEAIQLVQDKRLIGLREAKEFVEAIERRHNLG